MDPQSSLERARKRPRLACVECRQSKARCDSTGGDPCTRCREKQKDCSFDGAYKRVEKRVKIQQLVDEVQQLRNVVRRNVPNSSSLECPPNDTSSLRADTELDVWDSVDIYNSTSSVSSRSSIMTVDQRVLEGIAISSSTIKQLFDRYFLYCHPIFELLDPLLTPDESFLKSQLLFWAIMYAAAKVYPEDPELTMRLAIPVKNLLWNTLGKLPHSLGDIWGMLVLSTWPLPIPTRFEDPGFILISATRSAAMCLGVHRPDAAQDFYEHRRKVDARDIIEMKRTWLACYIVSENIAASGGHRSLFGQDPSIEDMRQNQSLGNIPLDLRHLFRITSFVSRVHDTVGNIEHTNSRKPSAGMTTLLSLLEHDFARLRQSFEQDLSGSNQIMLLYAWLQLRSYHFLDSWSDSRIYRLLEAQNVAITLIKKASIHFSTSLLIRSAPVFFTNALILAATVTWKIGKSSLGPFIDIELAKESISRVVELLRQSSVGPDDQRSTAANTIEQLWALPENSRIKSSKEPQTQISSRQNVSVIFDAIDTWRRECAQQAGNEELKITMAENLTCSESVYTGKTGTQIVQELREPGVAQVADSVPSATPQIGDIFGNLTGVAFDDLEDMSFLDVFQDNWAWLDTDSHLASVQ